MKRSIIFCAMLLCTSVSFAQQDWSVNYANTIKAEDLKDHLSILSSDALEGRETGTRGQKMAAAYISYAFQQDGLTPIVPIPGGKSYYQSFMLEHIRPGKTWVKIADQSYKNGKDFAYNGLDLFSQPIKSKPVFAGKGSANDFKAIPVHDKDVIMVCSGDGVKRDEITALAKSHGAAHIFIIQQGDAARFGQTVNYINRRFEYGMMAFPGASSMNKFGYFLLSPDLGLAMLQCDNKKLQKALSAAETGNYGQMIKIKAAEITFFSNQIKEQVASENVLGMIEGSDKRDEYVFITAHYDHLGKRHGVVNNGADDDGSGTVSVLEIAQAFAMAKKQGHGPRRSVIFMTVAGEEKGLLGSTYYVNHPVVPLQSTVSDLNTDMVGRIDQAHAQDSDYVYLIGSDKLSHELHNLSEKANATYTHLHLDYTYNSDSDPNRFYYRSDHYNFAKNKIPIIFYFNGTHPDYHKPTDTIEKINFPLMEKRARLVFHTAWELANREQRVALDADINEGVGATN